MANAIPESVLKALRRGLVIPACPLALTAERHWDERHQRALIRYYSAAGAGGLAVGVHTTQFAIRDSNVGLFQPLLQLAQEEFARADRKRSEPFVRIGGICGDTKQAVQEAELLRAHGYHIGLLSLAALKHASEDELVTHARVVGEVIPLMGFYLQPAVGGRVLPYSFWRKFLELESVVGIKVAPFNRYQTLEVLRAVADAGRTDIALYTGNDDHIIADLVTPHRFTTDKGKVTVRFVGGLLGQWAVWTKRAVELLAECHTAVGQGTMPAELLLRGQELTDANTAIFDAANGFAGCIAGVNEMLRRQGLLASAACLDPREVLSPSQSEELDRICRAYPHLTDDAFIAEHRDEWLR